MRYGIRTTRSVVLLMFASLISGCNFSETAASDPQPETLSETHEKDSRWEFLEQKDPITDKVSRYASLYANDSDDLSLIVLCGEKFKLPSVVVWFQELNSDPVASVIYRIDKDEPVEETWWVTKRAYARPIDSKADFEKFFGNLIEADDFTIRTKPISSGVPSETLIFNIKGIDEAVEYVRGVGECMQVQSST